MDKRDKPIQTINSVSELHRIMNLPPPANTLITLIDHAGDPVGLEAVAPAIILNFYNITIKRSFRGQLRYGKNYYDFDNGTMSFAAPNQILSIDQEGDRNRDGWSLMFHPDLIRSYPLGKAIKNYGFFSYEVNEALHLSDEEDRLAETLVRNIEKEYQSRLDTYSGDVIVSSLELLLNYCNRFYNRQFVTRKMSSNDLLSRFEEKLAKHFGEALSSGIPTVKTLAADLNVSPGYLSDMLRVVTGMNTQQHIHQELIGKAKRILASTDLSVSEIAFQLGFDYPQSFHKLFRSKTNLSPLEYRQAFRT